MGIDDPTNKATPLPEKIAIRRSIVSEYMLGLDSWEKVERDMQTMNLAWGKVREPEDVINQPTLMARGAIVEMDDRAGGSRPLTQSPYRFSSASSGVRGPAPHRGEHNSEVLADWLGFDETRCAFLRSSGALQHDDSQLDA